MKRTKKNLRMPEFNRRQRKPKQTTILPGEGTMAVAEEGVELVVEAVRAVEAAAQAVADRL